MDATVSNAIEVAAKAKATIEVLEGAYPNDSHVRRLHHQLNTLANFADVLLDQPAGTFGGTGVESGTVHTDTGGTPKGVRD